MNDVLKDTTKQQNQLLKSYTPIFALISALAVKKDFGDPGELAKKLREKLETTREYLIDRGLNIDMIADSQYAVIAFVDESINNSQWHGKEIWQKYPLATQMRLQANTGTIFFQILEEWRKSPNPPINLLEIYYICLGLGFRGKYFNQPDRLAELQRELLREITGTYDHRERLSPNGLRREKDVILDEPGKFPWNWFISGAIGFLFILFTIFKALSSSEVNELAEKLINLI